MVYCKSCGSVVEDNRKFCPNCGAVLPNEGNTAANETESVEPEKIVECTVQTAEIYYDGARLKTVGKVSLEAGTNRFYIRGISQAVATETIQLSMSGLSFHFYEPKRYSIAKDKELEKKISAKDREIELLEMQEELLEKNADFTGKSDVKPEEITSYLTTLADTLRKLDMQINQLQDEVEELQEKLEEEALFLMEVEAECTEAGEYAYTVLYVTRNAKWSPFYDIFASNETDILLQLKAKISQQMEKDWENCQIVLCSGCVNRSGNLPTLKPKFYRGAAPRAKTMMLGNTGMMRSAPDMAVAATMQIEECQDAVPEALAEYSAEIQVENVVRYVLQDTYRIIHGKRGSVLPIQSFHADGEFRYESCPKLETQAYLMAEIKDLNALHLMKCNANIFLHGNYVGETFIDPEREEQFTLSLGRDERMKVSYEERKSSHSKAFLKNLQSQVYDFAIQIENHTGMEAKLRIYDQIPVSLSQEIKVEPLNVSEGTINENDGRITWTFSLKPDEKKQLAVNYSVNWPKGTPLV